MAKKKRGRPRLEYLIRSIEVRSVHMHMSVRVEDEKGPNPIPSGRCWMEVRGVFDEPVKGQTDVVISVHEDDGGGFRTVRPAVIKHLVQMRPECRVVVTVAKRYARRKDIAYWEATHCNEPRTRLARSACSRIR